MHFTTHLHGYGMTNTQYGSQTQTSKVYQWFSELIYPPCRASFLLPSGGSIWRHQLGRTFCVTATRTQKQGVAAVVSTIHYYFCLICFPQAHSARSKESQWYDIFDY